MRREESALYIKNGINNDIESAVGCEEHLFRVVDCVRSGYCEWNIVFEIATVSE